LLQVILFEIDCAIVYTNLHELFCQFTSWTNWVNSGKFMDNCWISCQAMADMKKVYDDLIKKSLLHLNHGLIFWSSLEHETCQLLEIVTINYFPFSTMHFLCHTVMNFLRESWRNYICTIFFPRERLVRTREFCSCYYNFPLLYVLEWSKSRNISTELAKLP